MSTSATLGTLLRHLLDLLDGDVEATYRSAGLDYRPRFTPVMRALGESGPSSIRSISRHAGLTHSAASQTVAEMTRRGLVRAGAGEDGRERIVELTSAGAALLPQLRLFWSATGSAADTLSEEIGVDLAAALGAAIRALEDKPFFDRIAEQHRRGGGGVRAGIDITEQETDR